MAIVCCASESQKETGNSEEIQWGKPCLAKEIAQFRLHAFGSDFVDILAAEKESAREGKERERRAKQRKAKEKSQRQRLVQPASAMTAIKMQIVQWCRRDRSRSPGRRYSSGSGYRNGLGRDRHGGGCVAEIFSPQDVTSSRRYELD